MTRGKLAAMRFKAKTVGHLPTAAIPRMAEAATAARRVERRKTKVRTAVERVLDAEADGSEAENLFYDLTERLESDYEDADFTDRPIGELVARICRDLGVTPDWSLWQDEDWAIEARGAEPAVRTKGEPAPPEEQGPEPVPALRDGGGKSWVVPPD